MKLAKLLMLTAALYAVSLFAAGFAEALEEWMFVDIEPYANTKLVKHEGVDAEPWGQPPLPLVYR